MKYYISVRELAHKLWADAGQPEGRDLEFWLEAESRIIDFAGWTYYSKDDNGNWHYLSTYMDEETHFNIPKKFMLDHYELIINRGSSEQELKAGFDYEKIAKQMKHALDNWK